MMAVNASDSQSTGYTPSFITQGREPRLPSALYGRLTETPEEKANKLRGYYEKKSPWISPRIPKGYYEKSPGISLRILKGNYEHSPRIPAWIRKGYY